MRKIRFAAPLFILREECARDLFGVLDRVKSLGFDGVELLGFFGHTAKDIARHLQAIGLTCLGNHVPYEDFERSVDAVADDHIALSAKYVTLGTLPPPCMPGGERAQEAATQIECWATIMNRRGITLLYHNHAAELRENTLNAIMQSAPSLSLEPDLGWMHIAGADPLDYLRSYKARSPVIHFKDYLPTPNEPGHLFRPVGYGVVNYPRLMEDVLAASPEWIVADHDCAYERDSYDELGLSLDYIRELLKFY